MQHLPCAYARKPMPILCNSFSLRIRGSTDLEHIPATISAAQPSAPRHRQHAPRPNQVCEAEAAAFGERTAVVRESVGEGQGRMSHVTRSWGGRSHVRCSVAFHDGHNRLLRACNSRRLPPACLHRAPAHDVPQWHSLRHEPGRAAMRHRRISLLPCSPMHLSNPQEASSLNLFDG
jgi:hypothetical protein